MSRYGLPCDIIQIGRRRMGKSMLSLEITELGFDARNQKFDYKNFIDNFVLYSNKQKVPLEYDRYIIKDEGYLTSDRRRSMSRVQVESTADSNFYASYRAVAIENMQQFTDLDRRRVDVSTILIMIKKQAEAKVFVASNPLPIVKQSFGFDLFEKEPNLLKNSDVAEKILEGQGDFIFDITWHNREDTEMFRYYKSVKAEWQAKRHDRKAGQENKFEHTTKKDRILELIAKGGMTQLQIAREVGVHDTYVNKVASGLR